MILTGDRRLQEYVRFNAAHGAVHLRQSLDRVAARDAENASREAIRLDVAALPKELRRGYRTKEVKNFRRDDREPTGAPRSTGIVPPRERQMRRFKSAAQTPRVLSMHGLDTASATLIGLSPTRLSHELLTAQEAVQ